MNKKDQVSPAVASPTDDTAQASAADGLREDVLKRLWKAGAVGVGISEFGCKTRKTRALLGSALDALIAGGKVVRIDEGRRAVVFLAQFAPTVESVRQRVERTVREAQGALLSKDDLTAVLAPAERVLFTQALVGLLAEKTLVKLGHVGRANRAGAERETEFYLHATGLRELVAATFPEAGPRTFTPRTLLDAYRQLVQRNGFPDVEIFELHERLGLPLPELRAQILAEHEAGRAVLSFGDWSLAAPNTRSGAIEIHGDRYLRVRFHDGQHTYE